MRRVDICNFEFAKTRPYPLHPAEIDEIILIHGTSSFFRKQIEKMGLKAQLFPVRLGDYGTAYEMALAQVLKFGGQTIFAQVIVPTDCLSADDEQRQRYGATTWYDSLAHGSCLSHVSIPPQRIKVYSALPLRDRSKYPDGVEY